MTRRLTGAVSMIATVLLLACSSQDEPQPGGSGSYTRDLGDEPDFSDPHGLIQVETWLHMTDCTGSHGGFAAAEIECEGPDTGELVVPGPFLDALESGDWSHGECGSHDLERYHASAPDDDPLTRLETIGSGSLFYFPGR